MSTLKLGQDLIDFFYPVGSYYETSDINFNPNNKWGGTWVEDSKGRTTFGYDPNDSDFNSLGAYIGSKTHHHSYGFKTNGWYGTLTENFWLWRGTDNQWISSWNYGASGNLSVSRGGTDTASSQAQYMEQTTETSDTKIFNPGVVVRRWHRTA